VYKEISNVGKEVQLGGDELVGRFTIEDRKHKVLVGNTD